MSIGPMNTVAGSIAGSPLAQAHGAEAERAQQDAGVQQRRIHSDQKAEAAAGIGQTDGEDHETGERDADGRSPWKRPPETAPADAPADAPPRSKDTTGQSGSLLDLSG